MKNVIRERDIEKELAPMEDPFEWEHHCGACDWFGNEERCPFYNMVKNNPDTYWEDIGCKNFWD